MNDILNEKTIPNLSFFTFNGHVFGVDKEGNGVYEVLENEGCVCLRYIVEPVHFKKKAISKALSYRDGVVFIPFNYGRIVCYDIANNSWRELDLDLGEGNGLFLDAELIGDEIILLPFNSNFLVKINLCTFDIYKTNICEVCGLQQKNSIVIKHILENEDCVLFPVFNTNIIIRYFAKENRFEKYILDKNDFRINSITSDGNNIFLESRNSLEVIVTDRDFNIEKCIEISKETQPLGDAYTYFDQSGFDFFDGSLYCFPARWNHVIKIDTRTYEITTLSSMEKLTLGSENISKFNHGIVVDGKLYIQHYDEKIVIFDLETEKFDVVSTAMNDPDGVHLKGFLDYIASA